MKSNQIYYAELAPAQGMKPVIIVAITSQVEFNQLVKLFRHSHGAVWPKHTLSTNVVGKPTHEIASDDSGNFCLFQIVN